MECLKSMKVRYGVCMLWTVVVVLLAGATLAVVDDSLEVQPAEEFVIDGYRYSLPFDTAMYPQSVVSVLENRQESWTDVEQATWYVQLGNAHRHAAEEAELLSEETTMKLETQKSIAALHVAVGMFDGIVSRLGEPDDTPYVLQLFAASLFNLSEAYWLQQGSSGIEKSQHYNQQALDIYQRLMDEYKSQLIAIEFEDIELGWAHCRFRMGVALLGAATATKDATGEESEPAPELSTDQMDEILKGNMDLVDELAGGDVELMKETLAVLMQLGVGSLSEQIDSVNTAVGHFVVAVEMFEKAMDREQSVSERLELKLVLATTQQNLGSAYQLQEDKKLAAKTGEDAYQLFNDLIPQLEREGSAIDIAQAKSGACEVLHMLANVYLQLNSFELAKDRYRQAMDLFDEYNVLPPAPESSAFAVAGSDLSPQIQEYERLLEEYMDGTATDDVGQYDRDGYFDDGQGYLVKDDGYEADIHSSLGVLYMAQGEENVLAAIHLEQAARMYEQNGERDSPNMASVKLSLSELYLQSREYEKSAVAHAEAVNIFRATGATSLGGTDSLGGLASLIEQAQQAAKAESATTAPEIDMQMPKSTSLPTDQVSGIVLDLQSFLEQNQTDHDEL